MTQSKSARTLVAVMAMAVCICMGVRQSNAAPPSVVQANMDYDASGYVTPAGMVPPAMYQGGVTPVGFFGSGCDSCDAQSCDGGCDSGCGMRCGGSLCGRLGCGGVAPGGQIGGCGRNCGGGQCGILGCGGVLGKLQGGGLACGGCGMSGCNSCGGLTNLRNLCMFCRGGGCSACQFFGRGYLLGAFTFLKPYTEQGLCAQRWYDLSAEAVFLSHSNGGLRGPVTTRGVAPGVAGDPVPPGIVALDRGDGDAGDSLEEGMRLSASVIFGAGSNIEFTYVGGQEWENRASVSDPNPVFFSFVSDFGRNPIGGFDDTDRSLMQSIDSQSEYHSGEINYRRRTMGPYCRFQGSWLLGLRYVRYEDGLTYSAMGEFDNAVNLSLPRFFSSSDRVKNNLFGPQAGFDLWWNMTPGINLGIGMKGAWVQNDIRRRTSLTANSLSPVATAGFATVNANDQDTTVMGEFEAKLVYKLSHSWAFRTSYYAVAVDDIAFGNTDLPTINSFVQNNPLATPTLSFNSLVVQGFTFGAEYTW